MIVPGAMTKPGTVVVVGRALVDALGVMLGDRDGVGAPDAVDVTLPVPTCVPDAFCVPEPVKDGVGDGVDAPEPVDDGVAPRVTEAVGVREGDTAWLGVTVDDCEVVCDEEGTQLEDSDSERDGVPVGVEDKEAEAVGVGRICESQRSPNPGRQPVLQYVPPTPHQP